MAPLRQNNLHVISAWLSSIYSLSLIHIYKNIWSLINMRQPFAYIVCKYLLLFYSHLTVNENKY